MRPHPRDMGMMGLSPVTRHADAAQDNRAAGMESGATWPKRQTSLAANSGCWRAWPMGAWVTLKPT
jgi:hypothetical protein